MSNPEQLEFNFESEYDKNMTICHQYGLCCQQQIDLTGCITGFCEICPRKLNENFYEEMTKEETK